MNRQYCFQIILILAYVMFSAEGVVAQDKNSIKLPDFKDFPVPHIYRGKPAVVKLNSPEAKMFKTKIRQGAKDGPDFAGHYTIAAWGCGSACNSLAIIDAITGEVYFPPFEIIGFSAVDNPNVDYKLSSKLLIINGCPDDDNCGVYYYKWERNKLKLLKYIKKSDS